MTDGLRRAAVVVSALAMPAFSVWLFTGDRRPLPPPDGGPSPAEPAGYAFSIWGPIFVGALIFAVRQALPSRAADPVLRRIGWPAAVGFAATASWLVVARFGPTWATVPVIALILIAVGWSFVQAARAPGGGAWRRRLEVAPLGLFAGWVTAATYVNVAEVLPQYGFDRFGLDRTGFAVVVVVAAAASALAFLERSRWNLAYAAAVIWALAAVIVANVQRGFGPVVPTVAGAAVVLLSTAVLVGRLRSGRRSVR